MNTKQFLTAAGSLLTACSVARAGLVGPYTPDANTLHLWHFEDAAASVTVTNAVASGIVLTNLGLPAAGPFTNISLGNPSFTGFGNALRILPSGGATAPANAYANGGAYGDTTLFRNQTSGAFSFEAIVKCDVNPLSAGTQMEIIAGDSSAGSRSWQFRIQNPGVLNFNFITPPGNNYTTNLPSSGPNAAAAGQWYHVAVTFTGDAPTNSDPAGVLTFYWTLLDGNRTAADMLAQFTQVAPATLGGTPTFGIGGSGRTISGIANGEGFKGYIDEVRISDIARGSNQMAFTAGGGANPPSFTNQTSINPADTTVGFGKTLTLQSLASGTLPIRYQWQQGTTDLAGETNNALVLSNVTFAAAGSYRVIATNAAGRATSSVAQVTVKASFSELSNTGVDTNGTLLNVGGVGGAVDPHYKLVESANPNSLTAYPNAIVWGDGGPVAPNGVFAQNGPDSVWLGAQANGGQIAGQYVYRTEFVLDTGNPATARLDGTWWVSTAGTDIILNGKSTGITDTMATPEKFSASFTITNGFVTGLNTLDFVVTNASTANVAAFRAEFSGLADPLPAGPPVITNQPAPRTVREGGRAAFSVVALGRPPLTYQWRADGVAIPDATNRTLRFDFVFSGAQGTNFTVVVSNDSQSVTSTVARLTIVPTNQPPVAGNLSFSTAPDQLLSIPITRLLRSSSDPDGDLLGFLAADAASTNNVGIVQNGAFLEFTPPAGFLGGDQFGYTISDDQGSTASGLVRVTVAPPAAPLLAAQRVGNNLVLSASGGTPGGSYHLLSSADVAAPTANWTSVGGTFDASGNFSVTNPIPSGAGRTFYRLLVP